MRNSGMMSLQELSNQVPNLLVSCTNKFFEIPIPQRSDFSVGHEWANTASIIHETHQVSDNKNAFQRQSHTDMGTGWVRRRCQHRSTRALCNTPRLKNQYLPKRTTVHAVKRRAVFVLDGVELGLRGIVVAGGAGSSGRRLEALVRLLVVPAAAPSSSSAPGTVVRVPQHTLTVHTPIQRLHRLRNRVRT